MRKSVHLVGHFHAYIYICNTMHCSENVEHVMTCLNSFWALCWGNCLRLRNMSVWKVVSKNRTKSLPEARHSRRLWEIQKSLSRNESGPFGSYSLTVLIYPWGVKHCVKKKWNYPSCKTVEDSCMLWTKFSIWCRGNMLYTLCAACCNEECEEWFIT